MDWTRDFEEYQDIQTSLDENCKRFTNATLSIINMGVEEYRTIKRDCNRVRYMDIKDNNPSLNQIIITGNIYKLASDMNEVAYRANNKTYACACDTLIEAMVDKMRKIYDVIKRDVQI